MEAICAVRIDCAVIAVSTKVCACIHLAVEAICTVRVLVAWAIHREVGTTLGKITVCISIAFYITGAGRSTDGTVLGFFTRAVQVGICTAITGQCFGSACRVVFHSRSGTFTLLANRIHSGSLTGRGLIAGCRYSEAGDTILIKGAGTFRDIRVVGINKTIAIIVQSVTGSFNRLESTVFCQVVLIQAWYPSARDTTHTRFGSTTADSNLDFAKLVGNDKRILTINQS